jgi:hypothetical protein
MPDWPTILLIAAGLPLLWLATFWPIMWLAAKIGPWGRLARRYPETQLVEGEDYRWNSLHCGLASYSLCVRARVGDDQIRLWLVWPFSWYHPPLVLPRQALRVVRRACTPVFSHLIAQVDEFELRLSGPMLRHPFFEEPRPADDV